VANNSGLLVGEMRKLKKTASLALNNYTTNSKIIFSLLKKIEEKTY